MLIRIIILYKLRLLKHCRWLGLSTLLYYYLFITYEILNNTIYKVNTSSYIYTATQGILFHGIF